MTRAQEPTPAFLIAVALAFSAVSFSVFTSLKPGLCSDPLRNTPLVSLCEARNSRPNSA